MFFFVKQKTAYEMRISDWSSDGCSSDLGVINIITRKVPERLSASVMLGGIVQEDGRYGNSTLGNFWIGAPIASDTVGVQIYGGLNDRAEDDIFFPNSFTSGANRVRDRNINAKLSVIVAPGHDVTLEGGYNYL